MIDYDGSKGCFNGRTQVNGLVFSFIGGRYNHIVCIVTAKVREIAMVRYKGSNGLFTEASLDGLQFSFLSDRFNCRPKPNASWHE
mmetsp:Transcript_52515/g.111576  ORF Transcript_52515/g.111576 Transcript_52515/m.111576 type:complete len:85 (+) Transcript_52515:1332-1586(+)